MLVTPELTAFKAALAARAAAYVPSRRVLALAGPAAAAAARRAAVVCCVCWTGPTTGPGVLFTVRSHAVGTHKGQVSYPGGHVEPGETAAGAAAREVEEEVGVTPVLLGAHDDVIAVTGTHVTSHVGWLDGDYSALLPRGLPLTPWAAAAAAVAAAGQGAPLAPTAPLQQHQQQHPPPPSPLRLAAGEVEAAFVLPLAHLADPAHVVWEALRPRRDAVGRPDGAARMVPSYGGAPGTPRVWGLTAFMLRAHLATVLLPAAIDAGLRLPEHAGGGRTPPLPPEMAAAAAAAGGAEPPALALALGGDGGSGAATVAAAASQQAA